MQEHKLCLASENLWVALTIALCKLFCDAYLLRGVSDLLCIDKEFNALARLPVEKGYTFLYPVQLLVSMIV
jgi:hypothetical protein